MEEKNTRDTICRDCVFADIYMTTGSFGNDKMQKGCRLGLLDKYKQKAEVIEVSESYKDDEDIFDTNITYFKIKKRLCIGCRNKGWLDSLNGVSPEQKIKEEWELPVTYIIYVDDSHNLNDLELTIRSINSLQNMPDICIFIDNSEHHNIKLSMFNKALKNLQTKWKVSINTSPLPSIEQCIDAISNNITGIYFSVYSAGNPVYDTVELYHLLRVELEQVVMFEPDELNEGLTILTAAYFAYGQNKDHCIISKIKNQAEISKCPNLVRPISALLSQ